MDHLPYPQNAHYPRIEIPYLRSTEVGRHDGNGFSSFPSRAGWLQGGLEWFDCESSIAATRAQSWLFFGLLQEVLGDKFHEADYIAYNARNESYISTAAKLPHLLDWWSTARTPRLRRHPWSFLLALLSPFASLVTFFNDRSRQESVARLPKLPTRVRSAIVEAEKNARRLETAFPDHKGVGLVCLAIRSLVWSLRNAAAKLDFTMLQRKTLKLSTSLYLDRLLLQRGICPHYLSMAAETSSVTTLHYLSGLYRPLNIHYNCTQQSCVAHIINPQTYQTKHIDENCGCSFLGPDTADIRKSIDSGNIPLIRVSLSSNTTEIVVAQAEFDVPYTAISHVWSDGLGNEQSVALPACQIRRICSLIKPLMRSTRGKERIRFYDGIRCRVPTPISDPEFEMGLAQDSCLIWIDTLCLPKEDSQRKSGINQMNRIYAGAQNVVVLCRDLHAMRSDVSTENILASLVTSPWMARCWTYPESRLAQQLLIDVGHTLKDPFIIYDQMMYSVENGYKFGDWSDRFQFERELASALYRLRPLKDDATRGKSVRDFVHIWNEISNRTASKPEDVITILALMLDLSVSQLNKTEASQRIRAALCTCDYLPASFLLNTPGNSRDNHSDYDWVPTDLSNNVDIQHGTLQKLKNIGTGEPGFRILVPPERGMLVRCPLNLANRNVHLYIDNPRWQGYGLQVDLPERLRFSDDVGEALYLIYEMDKHMQDINHYIGKGCRFKIIKDASYYIVVAYDCSFKYTIRHNERAGTSRDRCDELQGYELISPRPDIRLVCDWSQWPVLEFQRAISAPLLMRKHGSSHPYAVVLLFWEAPLGFIAIGMVLFVFPTAPQFSKDFWTEASPLEWSLWGLSIIGIIARFYVEVRRQIPRINKMLKANEYRKWTASFDRPITESGRAAQSTINGSLICYQYSWWTLFALLGLGVILVVVGLSVDQADLYDLALTGGYILTAVIPRVLMEFWWRHPSMQVMKHKLSKLTLVNSHGGTPNTGKLITLKAFSPRYVMTWWHEARLLMRYNGRLEMMYQDPLYLPGEVRGADHGRRLG